jgi:peptidoglycan/xylan/chitin deacetylase (PgdA/CDA1 family)
MKLALKIDVDTYRGTRRGVPRLVELLEAQGAGATFLFSLGPDNTGKAIRRIFRSGFFGKVRRTSVLRHYGLLTLLYGTVLPAPDIGEECADAMRAVRDAGFEVGIHAYDHVKWQDYVARRDAQWTLAEMHKAQARFEAIFGEPARVHGAAGWQMNRHAYRLTQRLGFDYASDTRGTHPFIPVCQAEIVACPQLPTTLPTLDELLGVKGIKAGNVADHLLRLTATPSQWGHVYTAHAELEGMKLRGVLEALLRGWRAQGYEVVSLHDYLESLDRVQFPRHEVAMHPIAGRSGLLAAQGPEFLAQASPA